MRRLQRAIVASLLLLSVAVRPAQATPPSLPYLTVQDYPNDDGTKLLIQLPKSFPLSKPAYWRDPWPHRDFTLIRIRDDGLIDTTAFPKAGLREFVDQGLSPDHLYRYELVTRDSVLDVIAPILRSRDALQPKPNLPKQVVQQEPPHEWFARERLGEGIVILLLFAIILHGTYRIRQLYIRPIGGLKAIEEALGRAVEMGKPVLFSAGWGAALDKPTTMAAMNIFGWLAQKAAEYGARLTFPSHDAVIMAAAQEAASESARLAGRPEWYRESDIYYVTGSQFGYAAALDGVMAREKPAANLWLGTFAAEALILSETGNHIGAMQISGTDSTIQLAFFLVTCDYTLIGEEVFAASGYLTRDQKTLGGIWAQDMLKIAVAAVLVVGMIGAALGWPAIGNWLKGI
jgi:hypothetical protein